MRKSFTVGLVTLDDAIRAVRARTGKKPLIVSESADSPTAGATGDSPAMVAALVRSGQGLRAFATLVDVGAVATCHAAGVGASVDLHIGATIDDRFHGPVAFAGRIDYVGAGAVRLEGPVYTGMEVSMGRHAVVSDGSLSVLLTERPACTFDPATFRSVGLLPETADLIAVRSANLFRPGFADISTDIVFLDLPGASTPRLETLRFTRAPRPLYPVDGP
jgi:microcystin degradation protein MlrC